MVGILQVVSLWDSAYFQVQAEAVRFRDGIQLKTNTQNVWQVMENMAMTPIFFIKIFGWSSRQRLTWLNLDEWNVDQEKARI